jgi:surfactin family lipopeptide synthetase B
MTTASYCQESIYFRDKISEHQNTIYFNISLSSIHSIRVIESAIKGIIDRHHSLRTYFLYEQNELKQYIIDTDLISFSIHSYSIKNNIILDYEYKGNGQLHPSLIYVEYDPDNIVLYILTTHICFDGISIILFEQELKSLLDNPTLHLTPIVFQYLDFCLDEKKSSLSWSSELSSYINTLESVEWNPLCRDLKHIESKHTHQSIRIKTYGINNNISLIRNRYKLSLSKLFHYSLYRLLSYLSDQTHILFGMAINMRDIVFGANIGMFVNTNLFVYDSPDIHLVNSKYTWWQKIRYIPISFIRSNLKTNHHTLQNVIDIEVVPEHVLNSFITQREGKIEYVYMNQSHDYDCGFRYRILDDYLTLRITYDTSSFELDTIKLFLQRWERILVHLERVIENPFNTEYLLLETEVSLLPQLNQTNINLPSRGLLDTFFDKFYNQPNHIALQFETKTETYQTLGKKSLKLASKLKQMGVSSQDVVLQILPRGIEMVIGILGIYLSGGIYAPLHPEDVDSRYHSLELQLNHFTILTSKHVVLPLTKNRICYIEDAIEQIDDYDVWTKEPRNLNDLLYLITTSGTTGIPKLIQIQYESMLNFCYFLESQGWTSDQRVLQFYRCSFDTHLREIYGSLYSGATLVMIPDVSFETVQKAISYFEITIFSSIPSYFKMLTDNVDISTWTSLRKIFLTGEALFAYQVKRFQDQYPNIPIINIYGPAECTIECLIRYPTHPFSDPIEIGVPIYNTSAFILNHHLQPVGCNIAGELYIGGKGVMKGYMSDEQNQGSMIHHPSFGRLYRTGDIAYLNRQGQIIYVQRRDFQIKINGQRMESSEIELILRSYSSEYDPKVIKKQIDQRDVLICVYTTSNKIVDLDTTHIRQWCKKRLPLFMIPHHFIRVDQFPFSKNGKLNADKISFPAFSSTQNVPLSDQDRKICEICSEILHIPINLYDNFYSVGIHSLQFIQLHNRFSNISFSDISKCQTPYDIAQLLNQPSILSDISIQPCQLNRVRATSGQFGIYIHERYYRTCRSIYNINWLYHISESTFQLEDFQRLYDTLLFYLPLLSCSFSIEKGTLWITQHEYQSYPIQVIEEMNTNIFQTPFLLNKPPLCRVYVNRECTTLLLQLHHIVYDHGCDEILTQIISSALNKLKIEKSLLTTLDYCHWLDKNVDRNTSDLFWSSYLLPEFGYTSILPVQLVSKRSGLSEKKYWVIESNIFNTIQQLCQDHHITIHTLLLTLFSDFLHHYLQLSCCYIGANYHNRTRPELYNLFGYLMTFICYQSKLIEGSLSDKINWWKKNIENVYRHSQISFSNIISRLTLERKRHLLPFCSISFTQIPDNPMICINTKHGSLRMVHVEEAKQSVYPLGLFFIVKTGSIDGWIEYDPSLYNSEHVSFFVDKWNQYLLNQFDLK